MKSNQPFLPYFNTKWRGVRYYKFCVISIFFHTKFCRDQFHIFSIILSQNIIRDPHLWPSCDLNLISTLTHLQICSIVHWSVSDIETMKVCELTEPLPGLCIFQQPIKKNKKKGKTRDKLIYGFYFRINVLQSYVKIKKRKRRCLQLILHCSPAPPSQKIHDHTCTKKSSLVWTAPSSFICHGLWQSV